MWKIVLKSLLHYHYIIISYMLFHFYFCFLQYISLFEQFCNRWCGSSFGSCVGLVIYTPCCASASSDSAQTALINSKQIIAQGKRHDLLSTRRFRHLLVLQTGARRAGRSWSQQHQHLSLLLFCCGSSTATNLCVRVPHAINFYLNLSCRPNPYLACLLP